MYNKNAVQAIGNKISSEFDYLTSNKKVFDKSDFDTFEVEFDSLV